MTRTSFIGSLVSQAVVVIIGLLVAFGVPLTSEQIAAIITAAGFVGLILALVLWAQTVPREQIVERLIGDAVVAGEVNDLVPSGAAVRNVTDIPVDDGAVTEAIRAYPDN